MNVRKALICYNSAFWALLILMFVAQLLAGAGPIINFYVYAPMTFIFVIVTTFIIYPAVTQPTINSDDEEGNGENPQEEEDVAILPPPRTERRERIDWIDDLKILLISLVVVGHSAVSIMGFGAFLTLGTIQAETDDTEVVPTTYYDAVFWCCFFLLKPAIVPLFFFVSGYFSAASRLKYGQSKFLRKTFWRLGPPAIIFWLIVNPLNAYLGYVLVRPEGMTYSYSPGQAATWFLTWLMVFNCCYASIETEDVDGSIMEVPTFRKVVKIGLLAALLQGVAGVLGVFSGGAFAEMPCLLIGDGYFNALGYTAGALARTNDWLNKDNAIDENLVLKSKRYVIVSALLTIILCFVCFAPVSPLTESVGEVPGLGVLILSLVLFLPLGPYCPCVWIVVLNSFRGETSSPPEGQDSSAEDEREKRRSDKKCFALTKFMSGAAFSVFLFHYFFVTLYTYAFIEILDDTQGIDIKFVNSTSTADTALETGNEFAGFAFVASLSLVSSFLFGGLLKQIPGLGKYI
jgi:hypothetical protein